jgi:hypothetical protein
LMNIPFTFCFAMPSLSLLSSAYTQLIGCLLLYPSGDSVIHHASRGLIKSQLPPIGILMRDGPSLRI